MVDAVVAGAVVAERLQAAVVAVEVVAGAAVVDAGAEAEAEEGVVVAR